MAGACATISARQPGAHLTRSESGVPANAPSAHDSNSTEHVKILLKSNWLGDYISDNAAVLRISSLGESQFWTLFRGIQPG